MSYGNAASFTRVILDDNRDPWQSFANHQARKPPSLGGVDLVAAIGTPLPSAAGMSEVQNIGLAQGGSGGRTVRLWHLDERGRRTGFYDEYMHGSRFMRVNGEHVPMGTIVMLSGGSANGSESGVVPHWHWHLVTPQGRRVNPWDYFDTAWPGSNPAGGNVEPIPNPEHPLEEEMFTRYVLRDANSVQIGDRICSDGDQFLAGPGTFVWLDTWTLIDIVNGKVSPIPPFIEANALELSNLYQIFSGHRNL